MLKTAHNVFAFCMKRHISHLPLEILQECLSYLPFVCDEFTEIHNCLSYEEFLTMDLPDETRFSPGPSRNKFSPGNRPGVDVPPPTAMAQWRGHPFRLECRAECRIEYWNWLDIRGVCVAWKHAADGSPAFNARVALQSMQTALRSLDLSPNVPLYVHAVLESSRWGTRNFRQFFFQLLENNMHRIAEIAIAAEPRASGTNLGCSGMR